MLKRHRHSGFTLIETLIALALLLAGVAGSALLLVHTLQYERESAHRRAALRAGASLAEELRGRGADIDAELVQDWSTATVAALPAGASARLSAADGAPGNLLIRIEWPAAGGTPEWLELPVQP